MNKLNFALLGAVAALAVVCTLAAAIAFDVYREHRASPLAEALQDCRAAYINVPQVCHINDDGTVTTHLRVRYRDPGLSLRVHECYQEIKGTDELCHVNNDGTVTHSLPVPNGDE